MSSGVCTSASSHRRSNLGSTSNNLGSTSNNTTVKSSSSRKRPLADSSSSADVKRCTVTSPGASSDAMSSNFTVPKSPSPQNCNMHKTTGLAITPNTGCGKKLLIKGFREKEKQISSNYLEEAWQKLKETVDSIHLQRGGSTSLEELYQIVENLCAHKHASTLYDRLRQLLEQHVLSCLPDIVAAASANSGDTLTFLRTISRYWQMHCEQMILTRSIFLYLDRTYVLQSASTYSIWDIGLEIFRTHVLNNSAVENATTAGILEQIRRERQGEVVDRSLIKNLLRMLCSLEIYQQVFESRFLNDTSELYSVEGRRLIDERDPCEYMAHVERRIQEESDRQLHYLEPGTRRPLMQVLESQLIEKHVSAVLEKGLDVMLSEDRLTDLERLYRLFDLVKSAHGELRSHFMNYIKKVGRAVVISADPERERVMVDELLRLKESLDRVVRQCFGGDERFVVAVRDAFESFINQRPNKPAELIAKFLDGKLRSGNKELSEAELEVLMDRIMVLFRFIHGKDVFEAFYKKDLAKRLLLGKSASVDAEKSMLSKLKQECGPGFTSKLEGMFKDMELSKELGVAFKQYLQNIETPPSVSIDMTVSNLTMGHWPTYACMEVHLPDIMIRYQELYSKFYHSKHSGRKLQWQSSLGHCLLKARFHHNQVKELQVSLFQTLVLLLFNDRDDWSLDEIKTATNIEDTELRRTLQSLACGKYRVIQKQPRSKDVMDGDAFSFNEEFTAPRMRIKINEVQLKETAQEQQQTTEQVFLDRQYQIDAAVVRIMKTRKRLQHNLLISELFAQLRFPAKAVDMKKRIESLIDRDYMCRDKDDSNLYHYVA